MSEHTKIEWTDVTWNPVRGCTKISPGCQNCYALRFAERFRGVPNHPYTQGFDLRLVPEQLAAPALWPKPQRVFVNSMSDLFHKEVPESYVHQVVQVMREVPWHTYQVLTKRADRMHAALTGRLVEGARAPQVWWGVSVEDRRYGLPRLGWLQATPVARRFLSVEPLLEDLGRLDLTGIDWVILGGESGPKARPMDPSWAREVRDQCAEAGIPFFFKQWGGPQKSRTGRILDGRTHDDTPTTPNPTIAIPPRAQRLALARRLAQTTTHDGGME